MNADELVKQWAKTQVRDQVPGTSDYLHYRDCPDIEVYRCAGIERPLSSVTPDKWTYFAVEWGCPHGPGRLAARMHFQGTMAELLDELADLENASTEIRMDFAVEEIETDTSLFEPIFAANYAAPGGGTVWRPQRMEDPPWLT